ncbi:MAG: response regulator transcription factor [Alphaproteobacteria bacterium]|jgi:two-component system phosphate regulon response regulator OmpR
MTIDKAHILIVDDDNRIRNLLQTYLIGHQYVVSVAKDTTQARELLATFNIDLIILDIMMPNETGIEFAQILRQTSNVAILMLTAMGDVEERIAGLKSGADDYIAKPFEPRELLIRIEKLINRTKHLKKMLNNCIIYFGQTEYDVANNTLSKNDIHIVLSSGESKLLNILIDNLGIAINRQELAKLCGNINERSIDVQITRLRTKIESDQKKPKFIQTIRGQGYILFGTKS